MQRALSTEGMISVMVSFFFFRPSLARSSANMPLLIVKFAAVTSVSILPDPHADPRAMPVATPRESSKALLDSLNEKELFSNTSSAS